MSAVKPYSDYDPLAWVYNKHWGPRYTEKVLPVIERLILQELSADARILDLCCGSGQLAQKLIERGFHVTGVDGSEEIVRIARENASAGEFVVDDARTFRFECTYDAALCVFDSLNHILSLDELISVFCNVYSVLQDGGVFLFDLNMEEGYKARWRGSYNIVEDDHVCVVHLNYRTEEKIGESQVTVFRLDGQWRRSDLTLLQRCYSQEEIETALANAGFTNVAIYDGQRDLQLAGKGAGRAFFVCRKPKERNS